MMSEAAPAMPTDDMQPVLDKLGAKPISELSVKKARSQPNPRRRQGPFPLIVHFSIATAGLGDRRHRRLRRFGPCLGRRHERGDGLGHLPVGSGRDLPRAARGRQGGL